MNKNIKKKVWLGTGALVATIAPIAAVVACGDAANTKDIEKTNTKGKTGANGTKPLKNQSTGIKVGDFSKVWNKNSIWISKFANFSLEDNYDPTQPIDEYFNQKSPNASYANLEDVRKHMKEAFESKHPEIIEAMEKVIKYAGDWKSAWYLMNFVISATSEKSIGSAVIGWDPNGPFEEVLYANGKPNNKKTMIKFIEEGSLEWDQIVQGVIDKFSLKDKNFSAIVNNAATVDVNKKELIKGGAWNAAASAMGGDDTIKYIFSKSTLGYKIVDKK